jgi:hypothetical protein
MKLRALTDDEEVKIAGDKKKFSSSKRWGSSPMMRSARNGSDTVHDDEGLATRRNSPSFFRKFWKE